MAQIFDKETLKEFQALYRDIISSLNECNNCTILSCKNCFKCERTGCTNCEKFRKSKWTLLKKCNCEQWNYVINFLNDIFNVSDKPVNFFPHLKPVNEQVKNKNKVFVYDK